MIGDVEQVSESVRKTITEIWDTVLLMLSYFVACLVYSPKITLLAAIPIPLAVFIAESLRRPLYKLSQKARKSASAINVHLQHNVSGVSLLRLFGLEANNRKRFAALLQEQLKWNVASAALQSGMLPLYTLTASLGIILVVGLGGGYVVDGTWSVGTFMAYLTMFTAMSARTRSVARVMNTWHGAKASWDRIAEKMRGGRHGAAPSRPETAAGHTAGQTDAPLLSVRGLSFRYPYSDTYSLSHVTFDAKKGEIIGVTGPVGSGKSALAAALTGLYPYEGQILAGGLPLYALRDSGGPRISWMDSDQFVFSDDVIFNVSLGRHGGDVGEAIRLAMMDEDIAGFENGMTTGLMERGQRISGGQRQRIALARAWYGSPDILLLDDPFSAVDVNMENDIMANIRANLGEKVVLLFSHRLLAFARTDRVIMLDNGRVSQTGTHAELLAREGLYRDIYLAQEFFGEEGRTE